MSTTDSRRNAAPSERRALLFPLVAFFSLPSSGRSLYCLGITQRGKTRRSWAVGAWHFFADAPMRLSIPFAMS